jgi:hypothetical protein
MIHSCSCCPSKKYKIEPLRRYRGGRLLSSRLRRRKIDDLCKEINPLPSVLVHTLRLVSKDNCRSPLAAAAAAVGRHSTSQHSTLKELIDVASHLALCYLCFSPTSGASPCPVSGGQCPQNPPRQSKEVFMYSFDIVVHMRLPQTLPLPLRVHVRERGWKLPGQPEIYKVSPVVEPDVGLGGFMSRSTNR